MNTKSFVSRLLKTLPIIASLAMSLHAAQAQTQAFQTAPGTMTATSNISEMKDSVFIDNSDPMSTPFVSKGSASTPVAPTPFKVPEPGAAAVGLVGVAGVMAGMRRKKAKNNNDFPYHMLKEYHSEFLD